VERREIRKVSGTAQSDFVTSSSYPQRNSGFKCLFFVLEFSEVIGGDLSVGVRQELLLPFVRMRLPNI